MLAPVETPWTTVRTEDLKRMWETGYSASHIAIALGNFCSRSAVLGKVHRLGLQKRRDAFQVPPRPKAVIDEDRRLTQIFRRQEKARRQRERREAIPFEAQPALEPVPLESRPCSLLDLTRETCRFPIGDPGDPDFHFCGSQPLGGLPYCTHHDRLAHKPAPNRVRAPFIQPRWNAA
jgi:GcrA cell cycle regulator